MRRALLPTLAFLLSAALAIAAPVPPPGQGPWIFRAYGWTEESLQRVGTRFDHVGVFPEKGYLLVMADDLDDWAFLVEAGLRLEPDERGNRTVEHLAAHMAEGVPLGGIPGFECYRTVEDTLATGAAIAAEHPNLATWEDVGDSWEKLNPQPPFEGFDIMVLRLTNSEIPGPKPAFLLTGSNHAREYVSPEMVTRFAEALVEGYNVDPDVTWVLDHHTINLVLVMNPDGRKRAETGILWRKNADNDFCTGSPDRGVDLNRNFDFFWNCCGGSSGNECSETYRGPQKGSEPETQAIQDLMNDIIPDQREPDKDLDAMAPLDTEGIYIDVHSFGSIMLAPWSFFPNGGNPPNGPGILTLGRKYAYFPGYAAKLGSTGIVDGSTKDYVYGRLGAPGYTAELGTTFFQECTFFEHVILPGNMAAMMHVAKNARRPYLTPSGPDAVDPSLPATPVAAGTPVQLTAVIDDTRTIDNEPVQPIAAAEYTLDTPPWLEGAARPMTPSDGAFDETVEAVEATVDTTGLDSGRHTLFVHGRDATDLFGAPGAAFLWIIDGSSPSLQGAVTAAGSGNPLAATVSVGPFEAATDPGTGAYSLQLPAGTYDVTAKAPGFLAVTREGVVLEDLQTVTENFQLQPLVQLLDDDVESGNMGWTAQAPWAITTEAANSPTHSWTDSPGGNYSNNANTSLTSPIFDLTDLVGTSLSFHHIYDFETGFDIGLVEVSTDGVAWTAVEGFSADDQNAEWQPVTIPLPMLDGQPAARFRFRVDADGGLTADGWHLDDILLEAADSNLLFEDGFESGDTSAWDQSVE